MQIVRGSLRDATQNGSWDKIDGGNEARRKGKAGQSDREGMITNTHSSSANLYPMHARFPLSGLPFKKVSVLPHSPGTARALAGGAAQRSGLRDKRVSQSNRAPHGDLKRRRTTKTEKDSRRSASMPPAHPSTTPHGTLKGSVTF